MSLDQWLGTIGVALLLLAYFLNIRGIWSRDSKWYSGLNALGAGLACLASWLISYYPFVVLEGFWLVVSIWNMIGRTTSSRVE